MELNDKIISALIAAVVSFVVAIISYMINKKKISSERERFEQELQRDMTEKLYDLRIEHYPKAMEITEGLRKSQLTKGNISRSYFKTILNQLDTWHATKAGFLLSQSALAELYNLRRTLRGEPEGEGGNYSDEQVENIWKAKGAFRTALTEDVQLLYQEDIRKRTNSSNRQEARSL